MKKLFLAVAILALPFTAHAEKNERSQQWYQSSDSYFTFWSSAKEYEYTAVLKQGTETPQFGLVMHLNNKCDPTPNNVVNKTIIHVDSNPISFNYVCTSDGNSYQLWPNSVKGLDTVFRAFQQGKDRINFVMQSKDQPDTVFSFPTKKFSEFYRMAKTASNKTV